MVTAHAHPNLFAPTLPPQSVLRALAGGEARSEELLRQGHAMPGEPERCRRGEGDRNGEAETRRGGGTREIRAETGGWTWDEPETLSGKQNRGVECRKGRVWNREQGQEAGMG